MKRRALLACLAGGVAGCTGASRGDAERTGTATPTPTERQTTTPYPTAAPGDCPDYGDATVVCATAADGAAFRMARSTAAVDPPGSVTFTLRNETAGRFRGNFYAWRLSKRVDGEWYRVAPRLVPQPLTSLPPGDTHRWTVSVDAALPDGPVSLAEGDSSVALSALGGGRYAFGIDGRFGDQNTDGYAAVAPFDLRADPLALRPTGAVTDVRAEDGRVLARLDRALDGDAREARYTLSRVGDDPSAPRRIAEQVVRSGVADEPLRDALALATDRGAATVELRGPTASRPPFGVDEPRRLRYEGRTYEAETAYVG